MASTHETHAQEVARMLRETAGAYHSGAITYDDLRARNRDVWASVETFPLVHERVLVILRGSK